MSDRGTPLDAAANALEERLIEGETYVASARACLTTAVEALTENDWADIAEGRSVALLRALLGETP